MKEKNVAVIPAFNEEAEKKSAIIVKNKQNLGYDGAIKFR